MLYKLAYKWLCTLDDDVGGTLPGVDDDFQGRLEILEKKIAILARSQDSQDRTLAESLAECLKEWRDRKSPSETSEGSSDESLNGSARLN